jgi:hypothetical protein
MSLALGVDVASSDGTRVTAAVGLLMSGALVLAASEQFTNGEVGGRGWLSLACALACAACCGFLCRRVAARRPLRLQVAADGSVALTAPEGGESIAAALVTAWQLGGLAFLRLRPAEASSFGSGDCLLLLSRKSVDEARWHALRRWLVWHRRSSRTRVAVAA